MMSRSGGRLIVSDVALGCHGRLLLSDVALGCWEVDVK